jgi:predicted dehydrogenase
MEKIKAVLVGAMGYGSSYVKAIYGMGEKSPVRLAGAVDPNWAESRTLTLLKEMQVPLFADMEEFFSKHQADLCILSTPIALHKKQLGQALAHGCHVLCEKPAAGSLQDVEEMTHMAEESGKLVGIGFQMSYSQGIRNLKKALLSGSLGQVKCAKSLTMFPRPYTYFSGRSWAGKKYAPDGTAIWDSIANNAAAHSLHNMLFLLGPAMEASARPLSVRGQLYRANAIETFDGVAVQFQVERQGQPIPFYFYGAHFTEETQNPLFEIETDRGCVTYSMEEDCVRFTGTDGETHSFGPAKDHKSKLLQMAEAVSLRKAGREAVSFCPPGSTLGHAAAVELLNAMLPRVYCFSEEEAAEGLMKKEQPGRVVEGFDAYLRSCYEKGVAETYEGWNRWKLRTQSLCDGCGRKE